MSAFHQIKYSWFDNVFSTQPVGGVAEWFDFVRGFVKPKTTANDTTRNSEVTLLSPVVYKPGFNRGLSGVEEVTMAVLDMDGGFEITQFTDEWEARGLEFFIYTSFNHTDDFPKWRAVFPLLSPVQSADWVKVWRQMDADLAQSMSDPACKDASRMYFMPCVHPGDENKYFCYHHEGELLDAQPYIDAVETVSIHEHHEKNDNPDSPGNIFEARQEIVSFMTGYGWVEVQTRDNVKKFRRPGKESGISATWAYRPISGKHKLKVFTSSTQLPENSMLTMWGVYTYMEHGGDFRASAKFLSEKYNLPKTQPKTDNGTPIMENNMIGHSLDSFDINEVMKYGICGKYVPRQEITLLEARAGEGKSTLIVGIASGGSVGKCLITDEAIEPFGTMILTGEQRGSSLLRRCISMKGDPKRIRLYSKQFELYGENLTKICQFMVKHELSFLVADPIWDFKPKHIIASDPISVSSWMAEIQYSMEQYNLAFVAVNHLAKFIGGKDISELGRNNSALYSKARSGLVLFTDPETPSRKVIRHSKPNFETGIQPSFAYQWNKQGLVEWYRPGDVDDSFIDELLKVKKK